MAQYNSAIITNQGLILADKAIQGTASYEIKKVTGSTTNLNKLSEDEIKNLTTIPDDSKVGKLVDKSDGENDNISNISIVFDNKDLAQSYSLNSIGIWATNNKTKETILYAVITAAQPEFIPNFKEKVFMTFKLNVVLKIGNKAIVTIVLDNSSNATIGYVDKIAKEYDVKLNDVQEKITEQINPKIENLSKNKADIDFAKYPVQQLKEGDDIKTLSDGFYTSWGIKNLDIPSYFDNDFWGTINHTPHYMLGIRNDGNIYIKNHYANKWSDWDRLLNGGDSKKIESDIGTKASIEQAQYNVIRELTDDDDVLDLKENGHHVVRGKNPKHNPWDKNIWANIYKTDYNIVMRDNLGAEFIRSYFDNKWRRTTNLEDLEKVENKIDQVTILNSSHDMFNLPKSLGRFKIVGDPVPKNMPEGCSNYSEGYRGEYSINLTDNTGNKYYWGDYSNGWRLITYTRIGVGS